MYSLLKISCGHTQDVLCLATGRRKKHVLHKRSDPLSPHHTLHSVASRCLHSGVHSTTFLSSRSRSCPPAVRYRCSTQSTLGATACQSRRARHTRPARPGAWADGSDGMTRKHMRRGHRYPYGLVILLFQRKIPSIRQTV